MTIFQFFNYNVPYIAACLAPRYLRLLFLPPIECLTAEGQGASAGRHPRRPRRPIVVSNIVALKIRLHLSRFVALPLLCICRGKSRIFDQLTQRS